MSLTLMEMWDKEADPFVSSLFGIQNPWSFLAVVTSIGLLIRRNEMKSATEKEAIYIKPALLVLYGLLFGVSGAGVMLALAATSGGKDCFRCVDRHELSILSVSMRYLGYAYLCTLVFEMWMLSLEAMQSRRISSLKIARHVVWLMTTFVALKFLPVGYYAFCPLAHCVLRTLVFGTRVLESASPELEFVGKKWTDGWMRGIEAAAWAVISAQQMWVYSSLQCDLSSVNLMGSMAAAFSALTFLLE